ncbi:DUF2281 domain-containing protein [Larkinella soli]|uniref:DUF2281 domain-containing protein n=1 Tax=Larkinella soli TaxID=1770527 RepID=UPI000FFC1E98|nr:DUF2281 domain-containing protein [Larkinella soli]
MSVSEQKINLVKEIAELPDELFEQIYPKIINLLHPAKEDRIGSMKGLITYMAEDFDQPLDDFKAYSL